MYSKPAALGKTESAMLFPFIVAALITVPYSLAYELTGVWTGVTHVDYASTTCGPTICDEDARRQELKFEDGHMRYHDSYVPLKQSKLYGIYAEVTTRSLQDSNVLQSDTLAHIGNESDGKIKVAISVRVTLIDPTKQVLFSCICTHTGMYSR
jgi:hypothetical protein